MPLGLNRNATKTRRQYSGEFKCDAVRRVLDHGLPIARVARDLGVAESVISRWVATVRDHGEGALTGEAPTAEQLELRRLQIENQALRHERDLLRKAAALFAKDLSL